MLFEVVDERLPKDRPIQSYSSKRDISMEWKKVDHRHCSLDQQQAFICQKLGDYLDWPQAVHEYAYYDDIHQFNIGRSAEYDREVFLESKVYQAWKTRKIRGPGLLCATGLGLSAFLFKKSSANLRFVFRSITKEASATTGKTTLWYTSRC